MIAAPVINAPTEASAVSIAPQGGNGGVSFAAHVAATSGAMAGQGNATAHTSLSYGGLANWHGYTTKKPASTTSNSSATAAAVTPQNPPTTPIPLPILAAGNGSTAALTTAANAALAAAGGLAANSNAAAPANGTVNGATANGAQQVPAATSAGSIGTVLTFQPGISAGVVGAAAPTSQAAAVAAAALAATAASPSASAAGSSAATSQANSAASSAGTQAAASSPAATGSGGPTLQVAADLNARIVAGAAIVTSQPNLALASLAHQLLEPKSTTDAKPATVDGNDKDGAATAPTTNLKPTLATTTPAPQPGAAAASAAGQAAPAPTSVPLTAGTAKLQAQPTAPVAATSAAQNETAPPSPPTPTVDPTVERPVPTAAALIINQALAQSRGAADPADDKTDHAAAVDDASAANSAAVAPALAQANASAATTSADATVKTPQATLPAAEQVAVHLGQAIKSGNDDIHIQLKPESLGAIDIKISVTHDGRLTAVISADRSDTLNMLKQDQGSLQQSLRDAGINTDGSSLSFNLRGGDAQSFAQNQAQRDGSPYPGGTASGSGDAIAASAAAPSLSRHSGNLDIQV